MLLDDDDDDVRPSRGSKSQKSTPAPPRATRGKPRAGTQTAKAKAKSVPKTRGKKKVSTAAGEDEDEDGEEDEIIQFDDDIAEEGVDEEEEEEEEVRPKPKPKKSRVTASRCVISLQLDRIDHSSSAPRKAPPAKPATKKGTQNTLSFVPSSRGSRATASKKKTVRESLVFPNMHCPNESIRSRATLTKPSTHLAGIFLNALYCSLSILLFCPANKAPWCDSSAH